MAGMSTLYYLSVIFILLRNDERMTNGHLEDRERNGNITLIYSLDYPHVLTALSRVLVTIERVWIGEQIY
jgi:hypothetical protein